MIDKFQGCLLGFAVGDALAAPIEDVIRDTIVGPSHITEYVRAFPSHPVSHLEPGQWSDETQIMLVVAESLISSGGFCVDELVKRFVDWFHQQRLRSAWRFPSNTMTKACRKLAAGTHWSQSGFPSAGVIAVVRIVPLALLYYKNPAILRDAIEKSCRITHTDPRVIAASMILATVIKFGLEGAEPVPDQIFNSAIEKSQVYSSEVVKVMKTLKEAIKLEPKFAMEQIGNSGYCLDSLPNALYWFFRYPRNFDDMIIGAANVGGDSDAIAAMAGAVFGAFNGKSMISEKWLKSLEDRYRIEQIAVELYRLSANLHK